MSVQIRAAAPADVPVLLDLYRELDLEPRAGLPLAQASALFAELTEDPRHRIFVAEDRDAIVGTFALIMIGGLPHGGRPSCIVEDVVVAPGRQRRGIGRQMMDDAMRRCAAAGCYKLVLSSHLRRADAHRFYEDLGFRRHGYSFLIDDRAEPAA